MLKSIATNPIFIRLTRSAKRPSLRGTLWIAGASALFSALGGIGSATSGDTGVGLMICGLLNFILTIPAALCPSITAAFAGIATSDDVRSKDYDMFKLTLITPQRIVTGYVFAWLYRLRVLWAIVIGLSCMGLFQWIGLSLSDMLLTYSVGASFRLFSIAFSIIQSTFAILRVIGLAILASSVGVALSLLWRQRGLAATVAAIVMIILQAIGFLVSSVLPYMTIYLYTTPVDWDIDLVEHTLFAIRAGFGIVSAIVVYLLAWGAMRLAHRWV